MPPKAKTFTGDWQPRKATDAALSRFAEAFSREMGAEVIRRPKVVHTPSPTGSLALDAALKIGGWPKGRIVEVWGPEHAGKSSLALLSAAEAQQEDPDRAVGYIDMEQTFDSEWAETLGVDLDRLVLFTPNTAEDVADATYRFVSSGLFSMVILDSVGGMISKVEFEKEADEATVGLVAKTVTRMVKQAAPISAKNKTTLLVINQVRAKIGGYGPSEDTGGGWALKHVTSVKIQVRRGEPIRARVRGEEVTIGHEVVCRIQKNKVSSGTGTGRFTIINQDHGQYTAGVDKIAEIFDVAKKFGVLGKGGWTTLPDGERVQGRDKSIAHLRDHPSVALQIRQMVLDSIKTGDLVDEDEVSEDYAAEQIAAEMEKIK